MIKSKAKVYIDGANIFYTQKQIGWNIDWKKVKKYLEKKSEIIEMRYYTGVKKNDIKMSKYLNYFDKIAITTVTKPIKIIKTINGNIFKSNFDVEMATDVLLDRVLVDKIILFTGDSDFNYLIKKLKDLGKYVVVYSSRKMLSWELKLNANQYFFLEDIKSDIERKDQKKPPSFGRSRVKHK
ncbi:MAG: NYN domain-containing protein [Patescibacteria group bacterium]